MECGSLYIHPLITYKKKKVAICRFFFLSFLVFVASLVLIMEKAMAPHSSTLVWKTPWVEEPGRWQSMESQRVGHD